MTPQQMLMAMAAEMADGVEALHGAAEVIGDGAGPEEIAAAIIQTALARRLLERVLEETGKAVDQLADLAAETP